MTSGPKIVAATAFIVAAVGIGVWFIRSAQIDDAYLAALADCDAGLGDAKLRALDQLHGEDRRPRALAIQLSLCALDGSVDRYKDAKQALDTLNP
jgi:hypothetical protein